MKNIQQVIIIRKDLLKINECELNNLSKDKRDQYYKELAETGKMGPGKLSAQVAHASLAPILMKMREDIHYKEYIPPKEDYSIKLDLHKGSDLTNWIEGSFKKIILYVKSEEKLLSIYKKLKESNIVVELITDIGLTEFKKPTNTCIGIEPLSKDKIDIFTKKLRLLD